MLSYSDAQGHTQSLSVAIPHAGHVTPNQRTYFNLASTLLLCCHKDPLNTYKYSNTLKLPTVIQSSHTNDGTNEDVEVTGDMVSVAEFSDS